MSLLHIPIILATVSSVETNESILAIFSQAGPVVKFVIIFLLLMSISCWTIIFMKFTMFRSAIRKSEKFIDVFWNSKSLANAYNETKQLHESHIAEVFRHGYIELGRLLKVRENDGANLRTKSIGKSMSWTDNLDRSLRRAINNESQRLGKAIPFLATTGNTAPFIGLFGTVWGIMDSFHGIAQKGNASLAVVAPGIAEALVATAAGLVAAIPAVVAYNYFVTKLEGMNIDMEAFKDDFLNIIRREMMKSSKKTNDSDDV